MFLFQNINTIISKILFTNCNWYDIILKPYDSEYGVNAV